MRINTTKSRESLLRSLSLQVGKLERDMSSVSSFRTWFVTARWGYRRFDSSGLNSLMWAIDTLMIEYEEDPDTAETAHDLAEDIRRVAGDLGAPLSIEPKARAFGGGR